MSNPWIDFHLIFRIYLPLQIPELVSFEVLTIAGISQNKLLDGCFKNVEHMLSTTIADLVSGNNLLLHNSKWALS